MRSDLAIGVVGPGWWLRDYLLTPLRSVAGVEVRAVVAGSRESAARAALELGIASSYEVVEDMLAHESLDALLISAPPSAHGPAIRLAARHGLNLYCEKPLARSAAEAAELVDVASDCSTVVGFTQRWNPALRELRRLVLDGALGTVQRARYTFLNARALASPERRSWEYQADEYSLGILSDLGSHAVDVLTWVLGPLGEALAGRAVASGPGTETWDDVEGSFRTAAGVEVALHVSRIDVPWPQQWYRQRLAVHGSHGSLVYDSACPMLLGHEKLGQISERVVPGLRSGGSDEESAGALAQQAQAREVVAVLRGEPVDEVADFRAAWLGQVWLEQLAEVVVPVRQR